MKTATKMAPGFYARLPIGRVRRNGSESKCALARPVAAAALMLLLAAVLAHDAAAMPRPLDGAGGDHLRAAVPRKENQRKRKSREVTGERAPVCTGVTADRSEVFVGDTVGLMAQAAVPTGEPLTYVWSTTGGRVVGSGSNVQFDTTGLAPGTYTVTAQVDDGFKHVVDCSVAITVKARPNGCPTVTLAADKVDVRPGEIVTFTATASGLNDGLGPASLTWETTAGSLEGSGSTATLDTTGLRGMVTVTARAGALAAGCPDRAVVSLFVKSSTIVDYWLPGPCFDFPRNSARVKDECKAILDDLALRLRHGGRIRIVVDGHADTGERSGIALRRAKSVRDYFVAKRGVDSNRIIVRSFDDTCPFGDAPQNRRVEFYFLPDGISADDIHKHCPGGAAPGGA